MASRKHRLSPPPDHSSKATSTVPANRHSSASQPDRENMSSTLTTRLPINLFDTIRDDLTARLDEGDPLYREVTPSTLRHFCEKVVEAERTVKSNDASSHEARVSHHWNSIQNLEASANLGCLMCRAFIHSARILEASGTSESLIRLKETEAGQSPALQSVGIAKYAAVELFPGPKFQIATTENDMRSSMPLVKEWFNRCELSHNTCCGFAATIAPTRLVFLSNTAPHLVTTTFEKKFTRYATLSHCWGLTEFKVLTRATTEAFHRRIPQEALSKTFRDAMWLTKRLDLDYIWIDSLCIVQDDEHDWMAESAMMGSVYAGSTINIAASAAADGNGGCFVDRGPRWPCRVNLKGQETSSQQSKQPKSPTVSSDKAELFICVPEKLFSDLITDAPLSTRGWAFQEKVLAPKTLSCTKEQLVWRCHEAQACEAFPQVLPSNILPKRGSHKQQEIGQWTKTVSEYSRAYLTKESDKLIALSGLAQFIQSRTSCHYLAGLWQESLSIHLCWCIQEGCTAQRTNYYRAPTWSWASLDAAIDFARTLECDSLSQIRLY